jgi:large subunit ribosomal protein L21
MYAIVEIAGRQYRVEENQFLVVNRLSGNAGDKLTFDKVLLIGDKGKMKVGEPTIKGAVVSATVEKHGRGDKVVVFKKKRRKGYVKRNGHRQDLTGIRIQSIKTKAEKAEAATTEEN